MVFFFNFKKENSRFAYFVIQNFICCEEQRLIMKILFSFLISLLIISNTKLFSAERTHLTRSITAEQFYKLLIPGNEWIDLPSYDERNEWEKIPEEFRSSFINKAEKLIEYEWFTPSAAQYLEYERSGSRKIFEVPYNEKRNNLEIFVLAELCEGKGRFIDQIINGVWSFCEQTYWGLSAHLWLQKSGKGLPDVEDPTIDLGAANIGYLLSWVNYFFKNEFDKVNPFISRRIEYEIQRKILQPYYTRNDFWWMGFNSEFANNWNPWINFNVLNCILLVETDRDKKVNGIYKIMSSLDKFINYYKDDGGCDEGPSYWQHAAGKMFQSLDLLYKITNGGINIFENSLIKNMGSYIYKVYIGRGYFINFADALNKVNLPPGLIYHYGKRINDPGLKGFGAYLAQNNEYIKRIKNTSYPIAEILQNLFTLNEILIEKPVEPLIDGFYLADIQAAGARQIEGSTKGFFFAAKGGHNEESHNHNDVGNFILYYDGEPVLVDAGVGTYTRQTFSGERYTLWNMQSAYHNLPTINNTMQREGKNFFAENVSYSSSDNLVKFSMDISKAYPDEAKVNRWQRDFNFVKNSGLEIIEQYELAEINGDTYLNFLTNRSVEILNDEIKLGDKIRMNYDNKQLEASFEKVNINDERLEKAWPEGLNRLRLKLKTSQLKEVIKILITDNH